MDKIFICLAEWAVPFSYDGESDVILKSNSEVGGLVFNIEIIRSSDSYGLDLYLDKELVQIKDNSLKERNLIKELDKYFMSKLTYNNS